MPDSRLETTRLLAKVFNIEDFLSPDSLSHDELNYYHNITRVLDSHIDKYVDWLGTPEAQEAFYQESVQRKEYFQSIDDDLDAIIDNHKLTADKIIEKIYRRGLKKGYTEISRRPVFNDACKYGLKATQDYNFELITNLSDDLRESIKHDIFKGIAEEKSIHEVARSITDAGLKPLKDKTLTAYQRASLIARTEISRSMSTGRLQAYANYGVEKVTILTAGGRENNVCPICLEAAAKDDVLIEYTLKEAQGLIPFHPACRCSIRAVIKHVSIDDLDKPQIINLTPHATEADDITDAHLNDTLTLEKLNKMTFDELAKHHNITYAGVEKYSYDGKKYHKFVETFDDGRDFVLRFEEGAVKSYLKQGIATPNEIIHEVFKVPRILRNETREIWFKNNNAGIVHKGTKTGYDSLSQHTAGYNAYTRMQDKRFFPDQVDFNHCIVINPKYFKGGGKGRYAFIWEQDPEKITSWKKTIHHEFTHSIDTNKEKWDANDHTPVSYDEEYMSIHHRARTKDLPGFTWYANTQTIESYAEHGGYISYMFANPSEQKKKVTIEYRTKEGKITKDINFEEYKELYPQHYEYFTKKLGLV